ncbi:hypothetical protein PHYPSEUDO_008809 [Phytophthora pseudosyringae]|uniref:Transmembrane protein n=1 Tax=Phytophthora pseudosyringae TaxID=221518 RepID=A0A8T1W9X8_9STRA|nr:hypothetical protein PHYPSEUDO_008809 [Phytophthora pseudosyringae]
MLSPKKRSKVHTVLTASTVRQNQPPRVNVERMLLGVWLCVGMLPLLLQMKSYWKFMTPHKLTEAVVVPAGAARETANMAEFCPVEGLFIASAWWNIAITHYYSMQHGRICHFVVPQYNIHGSYILGHERVAPSSTTPSSCTQEDNFSFEHYFYHGSISYYAFYEEGVGTYCAKDKTAYVRIRGLGTFDSNGDALATDRGSDGYRWSYWYGLLGLAWMIYRVVLLRRSFVLSKRYGRAYDRMGETLSRKAAVVYMQESMRLSPHNASNCCRVVVLYLLLEGVMSDLFLLIAQDGVFAKTQYISLGYNLSGVLSMVFEMLESSKWLHEKPRLLLKRLLFSYETCLVGELLSAAVMNHYLTWINRSHLRESKPTALAVSYYVWSLVGHGVLVFGLAAFIISVRVILASVYIVWMHRSLKVLTAPCSVDTILGVRSKMVMLGGYAWQNHQLFYRTETLKAFGVMKLIEEDGAEYFAFRRIRLINVRRDDLLVIGRVVGNAVEPCVERQCMNPVTLFDRRLGGPLMSELHCQEFTPQRVSQNQLHDWNLNAIAFQAAGDFYDGGNAATLILEKTYIGRMIVFLLFAACKRGNSQKRSDLETFHISNLASDRGRHATASLQTKDVAQD